MGCCLVHLLNFGINLGVDLILWYNLDNLYCVSHLRVLSWLTLCFVQIVSPFGSWKSCACIFTQYIHPMACFTFFDPIYRVNSINSKSAKMCIKFNFISICTYLCEVCPMYCSFSNYFGPNVFGDHIVLECCFRYIGNALDAWLILMEVWWPNDNWSQARMI